jgi:hypothetical protein
MFRFSCFSIALLWQCCYHIVNWCFSLFGHYLPIALEHIRLVVLFVSLIDWITIDLFILFRSLFFSFTSSVTLLNSSACTRIFSPAHLSVIRISNFQNSFMIWSGSIYYSENLLVNWVNLLVFSILLFHPYLCHILILMPPPYD